jgi:hypothetical protein
MPKIKELKRDLADPAVTLHSFIVSKTRAREVGWWVGGMNKKDLDARNVLFQEEDRASYIQTLLNHTLAVRPPAAGPRGSELPG